VAAGRSSMAGPTTPATSAVALASHRATTRPLHHHACALAAAMVAWACSSLRSSRGATSERIARARARHR
jgi:hypothetical protein